MYLSGITLAATILAGLVLTYGRFVRSSAWKATVTPLASIIGSGFLVLGPILDTAYGDAAPLVMAALCLGAYLFGAAIRDNIRTLDSDGANRSRFECRLETVASWALAFAYIISVTYYLNLLGAFALRLTPWSDANTARLVTTGVFALIVATGWWRGFKALQGMEQLSVSLKLAVIIGLLTALAACFVERSLDDALVFDAPRTTGLAAITLAFGLIVTVQGFETSRYLGDEYAAALRIRSMRWAQWLSSGIYLAYIGLMAYLFPSSDTPLNETAVIDMMRSVAPILPALLIAAAISAQFSAAIADTGGGGGLMHELTRGRLSVRGAYALMAISGVGITWTADVFDIIAYASRAFAAYYALQAIIACLASWRRHRPVKAMAYAALSTLGGLMAIFGQAVSA